MRYAELDREICRAANLLRGLGVERGDRVALYMPMVPEIVVAFFAVLKVGAIAVPIFSGFRSAAVSSRLEDSGAKVVFTADGSFRRGKCIPIKNELDTALRSVPGVGSVIVLRHTGAEVRMRPQRDIWWEDAMASQKTTADTERMSSEDPAMIIYTSGTTGPPKGSVHTHAGALVQMAKEIYYYFDLRPEDDLFFWVTDIGWMMGPWMMVGVQAFAGTYMIFEGAPDHPGPDRLWSLVDHHGVSILGISPTAIRMLMRHGDEWVEMHDLRTLRILGSTGEPWDRVSWSWYLEKVGRGRCPIINISGGTEIVGCFLAPLPICSLKPCTLRGPGLGMDVDVVDEQGRSVRGQVGYLICRNPTPSMTRGLWNDPERYIETYWSRWKDVWYHGDWASVDRDGHWFLHGRADDTIKVAGRRVGPAEIEDAVNSHPAVSESAVIGIPHDIKGECIVCFSVLKGGASPTADLARDIREHVGRTLGRTLVPDDVVFVQDIPKTRSAKVVRRVIRRRYLGMEDIGDTSSIENPEAIDAIPKRG